MIEKFREGALLHSPDAKEDGLVLRVYQSARRTMYEVWIPVNRATWSQRHYVSHWAESNLELADNSDLDSSDRRTKG
jgi:hypothetical protein